MTIPFNKPHLTGNEIKYISNVLNNGKLSGNGLYTQKCQQFLEHKYGFKKCLLTTSCTDALEICAMLCDIHAGDEVIVPSYTFVSSALAFVRAGARIVFADSTSRNPNIDADSIEPLITDKTKAIVVVHYAGIACDMDTVIEIASKYNLIVVEDAAQAIDSYYYDKPLGSIGHLAAFSFHETKNIIAGEGGCLAINDERFKKRAEILWEKGTNRAEFFRGEVNKYGWVDIGSSFLPNEQTAAFLWAQLEHMDEIQKKRISLWNRYWERLKSSADKGLFMLPNIPKYATNNGHMFYLVCKSLSQRTAIINNLKKNDISAVFHYLSLHSSPFYADKHDGRILAQSDMYTDCLVRLPLFYDLTPAEVDEISRLVIASI